MAIFTFDYKVIHTSVAKFSIFNLIFSIYLFTLGQNSVFPRTFAALQKVAAPLKKKSNK